MRNKKTTAIVMAAGKGNRMHADRNKVYLDLCGKPVLYYCLAAFEKSDIDEIIIVSSPGDEDYVKTEIVDQYGIQKVKNIVPGGKERFESVYFGIQACQEGQAETMAEEKCHYIFIHDGARAFIRPEQINTCIEAVEEYKACVLAMPVKDTIRIIGEDGYSVMTPNRKDVWQMQTPQCFMLDEARKAFDVMMASGDRDITDDVMVLERYGNRRSKMIVGSYDNMKLTTPEDMIIGENILKKMSKES